MLSKMAIIGAGGRVGKLLRDAAARLGDERDTELIWFSRTPANQPATLCWSLADGSEGLSQQLAASGKPMTIFLLAGVTSGSDRELAVNTTLAKACLNAAIAAGVSRVLLASSSAVYGWPEETPISEDTVPVRPNPYGLAKLAMEKATSVYRARGIDICCLRIGNVLGADALLQTAAKATQEAPLLLDRFADGTGPRRSYVGPVTLLRIVETLARHTGPLPSVLNIAAPAPIAMEDLLNAGNFPWTWRPALAGARQDITLSCEKLKNYYDFSPSDSLPNAILSQLDKIVA